MKNKKGQTGLTMGLILGAILVLVAFFAKMKKRPRMTLGIIGISILVIPFVAPTFFASIPFLGFLNNPLDLGGLTAGLTDGGAQTLPGQTAFCGVEDTTITLSAIDATTAAAVGGRHTYKISGAPSLGIADAGTFTASPGDEVQVLWANGTSSTGNYFGDITTTTISCKGTQTLTRELYQNGTLTIEVFNEEGNLIDTSGENETLANGDVVTLTAKIKGTFQRGFPHGGIIVLEYDSTYFDDVILDFGPGTNKVGTPTFHSNTNVNNKTVGYEIGPILGNAILEGTVTIDTHDDNNPAGVTGSSQDIRLTFYPKNPYIDDDEGGAYAIAAIEDEDGNQAFFHATAFVLNID